MLGDTYALVGMAVWGWSRLIPRLMGEQEWVQFPHVKRHLDAIDARPAGT